VAFLLAEASPLGSIEEPAEHRRQQYPNNERDIWHKYIIHEKQKKSSFLLNSLLSPVCAHRVVDGGDSVGYDVIKWERVERPENCFEFSG